MPHINHLRLHRKQWALSQSQMAHLVGIKARSVISSYELGTCSPGVRFALAYQFIFGVQLAALFPGLAQEVEDEVMQRAAALDRTCRYKDDPASVKVRELLQAMVARSANDGGA